MRSRLSRALAATALAALIAVALAAAAPGDLDPTFSGHGWVRTYDVLGYSRQYFPKGAEHIAIQPDGKIIGVSEIQSGGSDYYFGVFRWTPNGDLDRSFGAGGWVTTELGPFAIAHAVALQRDGKIVVAGEAVCDLAGCFGLVRYNRDGSLDRSFGNDGIVLTKFPPLNGAIAFDVAVQPDGKIVAVGKRYRGGDAQNDDLWALARYLPNGRLDTSFSGDGRTSIDFGYGDDIALAVALQRDRRIVVAGIGERNRNRSEDDFAVARLRPNGTLDRTFSGDGRATVGFGPHRFDYGQSLDIQRDGRIVAAGSSSPTLIGAPRVAIVRLRRNGTLDRRFGSGGKQITNPVPSGGYARTVLVQPDGRILVGGAGYDDSDRNTSSWVLLRYTPRGRLDRSFGQGGIVVSDFGTGADWAGAIALQRDGRIVVGGSVYEDQAIARYRAH